jgi:carboxymethylenebutenolidase
MPLNPCKIIRLLIIAWVIAMIIKTEIADLTTATGVMRTYIHRPAHNNPVPAILFYSEIFQQTGPIERAAKFMAGQGYAVLVPEVFHELKSYRHSPWAMTMQGRDKGNADKAAKDVQGYDTDNRAMIELS